MSSVWKHGSFLCLCECACVSVCWELEERPHMLGCGEWLSGSKGPVWCRRSGGLGPGCEEGSRCGEMEAASWKSRASVELPGSGGINGGPGRRPAHGSQISVLPSSVAPCPSSIHPDAVALKPGRAKVPLLCELRQVIHFSEHQCSQL